MILSLLFLLLARFHLYLFRLPCLFSFRFWGRAIWICICIGSCNIEERSQCASSLYMLQKQACTIPSILSPWVGHFFFFTLSTTATTTATTIIGNISCLSQINPQDQRDTHTMLQTSCHTATFSPCSRSCQCIIEGRVTIGFGKSFLANSTCCDGVILGRIMIIFSAVSVSTTVGVVLDIIWNEPNSSLCPLRDKTLRRIIIGRRWRASYRSWARRWS